MTRNVSLVVGFWTICGDIHVDGPTTVAQYSLRERAEAAAKVGYTGMGFFHTDLMYNVSQFGYGYIRSVLKDNGMVHVEVEQLLDWFASGAKRAELDSKRKDLLDAAYELGARTLKCSGDAETEACDVPKVADAFAELCDDARVAGTTVALELMPFTNIRSFETARDIVKQAGRENGGMCLDIWHFVRGGVDFRKISDLPNGYIKCIELNDAANEPKGTLWEDTLCHRLYPGEGSFNCSSFIESVESVAPQSIYGVEVINQVYRKLPLNEQCRRSFDGAMAQIRRVVDV